MEGVNLRVRVLQLQPPREITTRFGRFHRLVEGLVEDASGQMSITFWDDHVESLEGIKPGDLIEVRNCFISSFRGERRINVGRDSQIRKIEEG
ncbi:MAG: hypothetical protein ACETVR_04300 [Candidatus Bathyarchaeia archaeon]